MNEIFVDEYNLDQFSSDNPGIVPFGGYLCGVGCSVGGVCGLGCAEVGTTCGAGCS